MTSPTLGTGLDALGMTGSTWQELLLKAYDTNRLTVIGELDGGQLLDYIDPSGARFVIMTAPPYPVFAAFDTPTSVEAEISMVNHMVALLEIHDDAGAPITELTANLVQGPLLVDEPAHINDVCLTALGLNMTLVDPAAGTATGTAAEVTSVGASTLSSGSAVPTSECRITAPIAAVERRLTTLTGNPFWFCTLDTPFPLELCLPATIADDIKPGQIVTGSALMTASVAMPPSCGGDCGSGGCGCGGH